MLYLKLKGQLVFVHVLLKILRHAGNMHVEVKLPYL